MMNIIYYQDSDGLTRILGDDELMHYKYIQKIRVGKGYRYLYTPEEVAAYNKEKKLSAKGSTFGKKAISQARRDAKSSRVAEKRKQKYNNLKSTKQTDVKNSSKQIEKGKSTLEKKLSGLKKTVKNEVEGAKRAKDIFIDSKYKKGDKIYSYYGDGKHYDEAVVTNTKKSEYGGQIISTKTKKKKRKTSKIERAALKTYRATHPYE